MSKKHILKKEQDSPQIGRREFLGGSLALGAGLIGASALAAPALAAAATAETPDAQAAGSTYDKYANTNKPEDGKFHGILDEFVGPNAQPIPPLSAPATWDEETDVVIVGTGNGGLAASLYLAQKKVKVIAVEKNPFWGGVSSTAGAWVLFGGTKPQIAAGAKFDPDAIAKQQLSTLNYPANGIIRKTYRQLTIKGAEAMDWFLDMGAPLRMVHPISFVAFGKDGSSRASNGTNFAYDQAVAAGADFRLYTACNGLVKEGDRVVGIRVKDRSKDREYYIKGTRAVLLCTGGFMGNFDMLSRWCPSAAQTAPMSAAFPENDGLGIRMGLGVGCSMNGWDSFCAFDGGMPDVENYFHRIREGDVQVARQPWLGIDITGNRYPYVSYYEQGWSSLVVSAKVLQGLPQHTAYVFFDADWEENTLSFAEGGCRKPETFEDTPRSMVTAIDPEDWRIGVERSIERGHIKKADNFTDLAKQMELDPDVVNKAVENWNAICEAGEDPEYNYRKEWLKPLKKPPYYSTRLTSQLLATLCGLTVNEKLEALDTNGHTIPGLYVASLAAGGFAGCCSFGNSRAPLGPLFLSFATGYIAAQSILGELD